jgi:pteridine reductase
MELHGKVALVTGGAVRLGRAMSLALAERGARLVVHYNRSAEEARALCEEIEAAGGWATALGEDLSASGSAERLARRVLEAAGGVDVLVNSASVFPPEPLEETEEAVWDEAFAVNLRAPFFLIRHLASTLRERKGVVVNMADLAGMQPWLGYAAHGITKAGMVHLTRIAARALAPEVRVVGIAPGAVLPPEHTTEEELERLARLAALRRNGSPEDVVRALLYLLDSDFVTGEILVVDGGRLLRG